MHTPQVAAKADGGFIVVTRGQQENGSYGALATIYDASGTQTGYYELSTEADPANPTDQIGMKMTALSDGTFAVIYYALEADGTYGIYLQMLDAAGAKVGLQQTLGFTDDVSTIDKVDIADLGNGHFTAVWACDESGDRNVYMQRFLLDGTKEGAVIPVAGTTGNQYDVEIAADGNGKFLIAYSDDSNDILAGHNIVGQLFKGTGMPADPNNPPVPGFGLSDPAQNAPISSQPTLVGLPTGGFFAVYIETISGYQTLVGQLFDTDGVKVGNEIIIKAASGTTFVANEPELAVLADGRIVVTWHDDSDGLGDTDGTGVHSKIIDPRGGVIFGTENSEMLLGSVYGNFTPDVIRALGGHDTIDGYDGDDWLDGGEGNDVFNDESGADTMDGGNGDDTFYVDDLGDVVLESVGAGTDKIIFQLGDDFTLAAGLEVERVELAPGLADLDLTGNEFGQFLVGNDGSNTMMGMGGNDTLDGGGDSDWLEGGEGNDTYFVDGAAETVSEALNGGTDTVGADFSYSLEGRANVENLKLLGNGGIEGTGNELNNKLTGNGNDNNLFGLAGNDTLDGGEGADSMEGGLGNDTYHVDRSNDVVGEDTGGGKDTVVAEINYKLGANLENLVLTDAATKGTGNSANNKLTGNALDNTLKGGAGNDTIDGGAGTDRAEGGKGNDTYVLGNGHDIVVDNSGADDRITSTISRKLGDYTGIENLTLVGTANANATGNAAANDLIGNSAANKLSGGNGNDLLRGMNGADILTGGAGRDTFDFNTIIEIGKGTGARDIVKDFQHGLDKLDLSTIDASTKSGNQAFTFVAAEGASFTGVKGQLIWDKINKSGTANDITLVSGDINGDSIADFRLELKGLVSLTAADFIL
jgi:Ca2+-binding RTX toxin-like protein